MPPASLSPDKIILLEFFFARSKPNSAIQIHTTKNKEQEMMVMEEVEWNNPRSAIKLFYLGAEAWPLMITRFTPYLFCDKRLAGVHSCIFVGIMPE